MAGGSDTVKDRVTHLEEFVGTALVEDSVCLAAQCAESASELVALKKMLEDFMATTEAKFTAIVTDMESLVDVFKSNIRAVKEDVSLLKKVSHGQEERSPLSKVKVPDPKQFSGNRNAKDLENFLWDMEQYFKAARISEEEKVTVTCVFLTGDAKLWWRTRVSAQVLGDRR